MYNVFKRPMFKRGGTPAQGTGIMSHVEPRVQAAEGFFTDLMKPALNPDGTPVQVPRRDILEDLSFVAGPGKFLKAGGAGLNILRQAGRFPKFPAGYPSRDLTQAPFLSNQYIGEALRPYVSGGIETLKKAGTGIKNLASEYGAAAGIGGVGAGGIYAALKDDGTGSTDTVPTEDFSDYLNTETPKKEETAAEKAPPTEKDIMSAARSEIENEAKLIKDLLKDGDYSKGEMALLIAESLATPGGFNKKLETARKLGGEIAKTQRKEDKAITLEAYKRFKEKERETIKAGKEGDVEKILNERINLGLKNSNKTKSPSGETLYDGLTADQYREKIISSRLGEDKYNEMISRNRISQEGKEFITTNIKKINELQAKQKTSPLNKEELALLTKITKLVKGYSKLPGFGAYGISLDDPAYIGGYSSGGRVNYAEGGIDGGEDTVDEIITSEVPSDTTETPVKPVMKLSYEELRTRLPQEITDDIVRLLSNSEQALQDFAYLQTQQDVGGFNVKYGVNLVLPPQA